MTENLKELYQRRKAFEMYGSEVPQKLLKVIEEAETSSLRAIADALASYLPREIEDAVDGSVMIAGDYVYGKLTAICFSVVAKPGGAHQLQETIATVSDIEERSKRNKSEYNRWFLNPSDILTAGDGTKFTFTTECGDNSENFRNHVMREFGWTIEVA